MVLRLPARRLPVMAIEARSRNRLRPAWNMARGATERSVTSGEGESGRKVIERRRRRLSVARNNKQSRDKRDDYRHRYSPRKITQDTQMGAALVHHRKFYFLVAQPRQLAALLAPCRRTRRRSSRRTHSVTR